MELKNVTYKKRIFKHGKFINKVFLNNVNYVLKPGTVTAIMGPSGSGKTTLLDILAFRRKSGSIKGTVLVNGRKPQSDWHRISGYVYQEDLLMETMTVKECIMFSANTRLPDTITKKEKEERVNKVMEDLHIAHIADRSIGSALRRGISGGEKRRVSIAMELVVSPNVMFLDEPTSGLDSHSALVVMNCLCELAKQGRTIAFSIHQPRPNIFDRFDEIILINQGNVVYAGNELGALHHFKQLGHEPGNLNPADFLSKCFNHC
jgi:ABC-type multidrug transport system ATPase subunit